MKPPLLYRAAVGLGDGAATGALLKAPAAAPVKSLLAAAA